MRNFDLNNPFNDMGDDDFRKEFMKFLKLYGNGLQDFIKKSYLDDTDNLLKKSLFIFEPMNTETQERIDNIDKEELNVEGEVDKGGEWEKRSWSSPDGSYHFSSFSRFKGRKKFEPRTIREDINTIELLEKKLVESVNQERYEDAAKIRDLIKSFKG